MFFWRVSPSLAAIDAHGHVRFPIVHEISHASDLEMNCRRNVQIILHGFASRSLKNIVCLQKKNKDETKN